MSTPINNGGPAFPQPNHLIETSRGREEARGWMNDSGMSLRDWFAGMALQGLLSKLPVIDQTGEFGVKVLDKIAYNNDVADSCFQLADAMLAERQKHEHP